MEFLHKIWGGDVWYGNCANPQKVAIDRMNENKLLMSCEIAANNRAYASFKDVPDFLETYNKQTESLNQHYYEILSQSPSLYFDLDFKISEFSLADAITNFIDLLKAQFLNEFGRKLSSRHIFILSASNGDKGSLHFIIKNGYIFRTPMEAKSFVMKINDARDISKIGDMIDMKVYHDKRAFRIIGSAKFGSDRILVPISAAGTKLKKFNPLNYFITNTQGTDKFYYDSPQILDPINIDQTKAEDTDEIAAIAIKLYKSSANSKFHKLANPIIKQINNDIISITFNRKNSSYCELCDRAHDSANTANLKIFLESNKIFECCHKSDKTHFIGNIRPIELIEPNPDEIPATFISDAIKSGTKFSSSKIDQITYNDIAKIATIYKYNEQYCGDNPKLIKSNSSIICQRASMGTGKTNAAAMRVLEKYPDKNDRIVIISFRVALAEQLTNDKFSQIPEIKCYNKLKGDITANKIVIQPESLHRYALTRGKRDFLNNEIIIDEISQVRNQFTGATFMKNHAAYRNWQMFKNIVKNSKHVHIMDANLSAVDIKWIQDIRKRENEPIEVYWNEYKNLEGRKLSITNNEYDIINQTINDVKNNKRVYVACNSSTEKIQAIADIIRETTKKRVLCICSNTLDDGEVKKSMADPNSEWGAYNCVISSPSVQSGISYDRPNIFDNVYGIFSNYSSGSADCGQMLNRIRHPINTTVLVSITMGNNNIGPIERADVIHQFEHSRDHMNYAISEHIKIIEHVCEYEISEYGHNEFTKNDLFSLIVDNTAARNKDLTYFIWNFIKQHHSAGYIIDEFDALTAFGLDNLGDLTKIRTTYKLLIKTIRDAIKTNMAIDLASAVNKTMDQIDIIRNKLKKNHDISKDEKLSLTKHKISKQYGTGIDQTPEWFKFYGDSATRSIYTNQNRILKYANFTDAISAIKSQEQDSINNKTTALFCNPENELIYSDAVGMGAIGYITTKPIYKKYKMMLEMIEMMGFTSIDTTDQIDSETIEKNIKTVHKYILADPENYIKTMNKQNRKIKTLISWKYGDPKFKKNMLQFVNGSINGEFGITISKVDNNSTLYILKNKYLDNTNENYFNNIGRPIADQKPGPNIPNIGQI